MTGKVKWFNNIKGFGFILFTSDSGKEAEAMVHFNDIISSDPNPNPKIKVFKKLYAEQDVQFVPVKTPKGWRATEVRIGDDHAKEI